MLKTFTPFTLRGDVSLSALETIAQALSFAPCEPGEESSQGWVPPRGIAHGALVEQVGDYYVMQLMTETKAVPGDVLTRAVDAWVAAVEAEHGRKPGKRERRDRREDERLNLLPTAFPRRSAVLALIERGSPARVLIGSSSPARVTVVSAALSRGRPIKALPRATQKPLQALLSASLWADDGEPSFSDLSLGRSATLVGGEPGARSRIRFDNLPLSTEEVREHLTLMAVDKLEMGWRGEIAFTLADNGRWSSIHYLAGLLERRSTDEAADAFDANIALTAPALFGALDAVEGWLGGLQVEEP